ncbi:MAG: hypothetical protein DRM98_03100, partial [Thermoplasmata archaeon]
KTYTIHSIKKIYKHVPVYDLHIEKTHNFFVNINKQTNILVHNTLRPPDSITVHTLTPGYNYTGYVYNISLNNASYGNNGKVLVNASGYIHGPYDLPPMPPPGSQPYMGWLWFSSGRYNFSFKIKDTNGESEWSDEFIINVTYGINPVPWDYTSIRTSTVGTGITWTATSYSDSINYTVNAGSPLTGAVRIDIYNDSKNANNFTLNDTLPSGRIWVFDLGSLTQTLPYSDGTYQMILENSGIMLIEPGRTQFLDDIGFYNGTNSLGFRVIQLRKDDTGGSQGGGSGVYRFSAQTKNNYLRELENRNGIYNFTLQIYGEHSQEWINYFTSLYGFIEIDSNTIRYPVNGKQFILATSVLKLGLEAITS